MNKKEVEKIDKEIQIWKNFKKDIKERVPIVTKGNYDKDAFIFTFLKISKKKEKDAFIDYINGFQENVFDRTFSEMNEHFKEKISREYIRIEDIPSLENIFGIIKDRIKSNKESIEYSKKEYVKHKKYLVKEKEYDKIQDINSSIFWDKHRIESYESEIRKYTDLLNQLKSDIRCHKKRKDAITAL